MANQMINQIFEDTKMAREHALLSNYDTSAIYYQAVIQQIQKLLIGIKDTGRRQKWQQVSHDQYFSSSLASWLSNQCNL